MNKTLLLLTSLAAATQLSAQNASQPTLTPYWFTGVSNQQFVDDTDFGRNYKSKEENPDGIYQLWSGLYNVRHQFADGIYYILHEDGSAVIGNLGQNQNADLVHGSFVVPETINTRDLVGSEDFDKTANYSERDFTVVGIEDYAFTNNMALDKMVFPASFKFLAKGALSACRNVTEITFLGAEPPIIECFPENVWCEPLAQLNSLQVIHVPAGSERAYYEAFTRCGVLPGTIKPGIHINDSEIVACESDPYNPACVGFDEKPAEKAATTITWPVAANDKPAGTRETLPGATVSSGATPTYTSQDPTTVRIVGVDPSTGNVTLEYIKSGSAAITVSAPETATGKAATTTVNFTVVKQKPTIEWEAGGSFTVGDVRSFPVAVTNSNGEVSYQPTYASLISVESINSDGTVTLKFLAPANSVSVKAVTATTPQYASVSTLKSFSISLRQITPTWPALQGDDNFRKLTYTSETIAGPEGLEGVAKYDVKSDNTASVKVARNADGTFTFTYGQKGSATVTVSGKGDGKTYSNFSATFKVQVVRREAGLEWAYLGGNKPAGTTETVAGATSNGNGQIVYTAQGARLTVNADSTVTIAYQAGQATIAAQAQATKLYNESKALTRQVNATKADQTPSWNPDNGGDKPAGTSENTPGATNTGDATPIYTSSDPDVVDVKPNDDGTVDIVYGKEGEACVTVSTPETAQRNAAAAEPICFTVKRQDASISWNVPTDYKVAGTTEVVAAAATKSDGRLVYASSDPAVVTLTVLPTGQVKLTYNKEGEATVSVRAEQSDHFNATAPAEHTLHVVVSKTDLTWTWDPDLDGPHYAGTEQDNVPGVDNTGDAKPTYTSSDETIVKVTENPDGTLHVEYVGEGEATITAKTPKTDTQEPGSATVTVTVVRQPNTLTWTAEDQTAEARTNGQVPAATSNSDAPIKYVSSDEAVVKVVDNGTTLELQYVGAGEATITATQEATPVYEAGGPAVINVTVTRATSGADWPTDGNGGDKHIGDDPETLPGINNPGDATPEYHSSDPDVVQVTANPDGTVEVTFVGEGEACVTAHTAQTATQEEWTSEPVCYVVTRTRAVITWDYEGGDKPVKKGEGVPAPTTNSDQPVVVTSSNPAVVAVATDPETGEVVLTYRAVGQADIVVSVPTESKLYTTPEPVVVLVNVVKPVNTITWEPGDLDGTHHVGDEQTVPGAEVTGEGQPSYTSTNPDVVTVTVNPDGTVDVVCTGEGTAEIVVTTPTTESEKGDEVRIPYTGKKLAAEVSWPIAGGTHAAGYMEIVPGPTTTSDAPLTVASSNPAVCTAILNGDGTVTLLYQTAGEAQLTAAVKATNKYAAAESAPVSVTTTRNSVTPTWNPGLDGAEKTQGTSDVVPGPTGVGDARPAYDQVSGDGQVSITVNPDGSANVEYVSPGEVCIVAKLPQTATQEAWQSEPVCFTVVPAGPAEPAATIPVEKITIVDAAGNELDKLTLTDDIDPENEPDLVAQITPTNATTQEVTWTSSDEGVAIVDNLGHVSVVSSGTTTITATANDGSGVSDHITILVQQSQSIHWPSADNRHVDDLVRLPAYTEQGAELDYKPAGEQSAAKFEITKQDGNVYVHFLDEGTVNIRATTKDRNPSLAPFTETWSVNVLPKQLVPADQIDAEPAQSDDANKGGDDGTSAIKTVTANNNIDVRIVGDMIEVTGAPADAKMIVYDLTGKAIYTGPAANLFITNRGIHFISINGEVYKVRN